MRKNAPTKFRKPEQSAWTGLVPRRLIVEDTGAVLTAEKPPEYRVWLGPRHQRLNVLLTLCQRDPLLRRLSAVSVGKCGPREYADLYQKMILSTTKITNITTPQTIGFWYQYSVGS